MGHLINPIGLRVGWSSSWEDQLYCNSNLYPEFLHSIFKVRKLLAFFFFSEKIEKPVFFVVIL